MAIIGIDLGTTNSLVSVFENKQATLIPNALGEFMTPSVVSFKGDTQEILIGSAAKQRLVSHPEQTVSAFKRSMGSNTVFTLGNKRFSAVELSALLLKQLKEDAQTHLGEKVEEAIISVPAYFSDAQRNATKQAGELAGLKIERLINEPTAAALAYDFTNKSDENLFVVIDLGGGTLDVSILDVFENVIEVKASSGDNFLGGEDFSIALFDKFVADTKINIKKLSQHAHSQLCARIEACKHTLSSQHHASIKTELEGIDIDWQIDREEFQSCVGPLIKRFVKPIERALRDSKTPVQEIDNIVLVGGATRMPWVRSEVSKIFRLLPNTSIHPDHVVALGASVQAALKSKNEAFDDVVLTDVCPYTLGVEVSVETARNQYESGHFLPIIERNSTVPISRERPLQTLQDKQTTITCSIYQGESRLTKNNVKIGEVTATVPAGKAGEQAISVRFTYDINGILEVIIKVESNGDTFKAIIKNENARLNDDEIAASLAKLDALKMHPRENAKNAELSARLERLYEESLGDKREYIADILQKFERIMDKQDISEIDEARQQISLIADELEQY